MTLPSYPPSGGIRIQHRSPQWWKVHARRYAIYYTISICFLFLWSGSYLRLSLQQDYENKQPVTRVRSNRHDYNANLPKRSIHDIASKLPMWNAMQHLNPSVTLTGTFRYRASDCVDRRDVSCEGRLHFPAVDLKNALAYDEAVDLIRNIQRNTTQPSVVGNIVPSAKTTAVLTRGGNKDFLATGSVTANQDALFLLQLSPNHAVYEKRHDFVMGLFDGHGTDGHVVSQYAALHLPEMLAKHLSKTKSPQEAITHAFLEIDDTLPEAIGSGSTAICLLRLQNTLYIANTGDSFAFVASHNVKTQSTEILYRTKPHKPLNPEEKKRIEAAGGEVVEPQGPGDSSRVIIPINDSVGTVMALAMSRSIGDKDGAPLGVIPDPTIDKLDLTTIAKSDLGLFAVVASDGLLDRLDEKQVAESIASSLFSSHAKKQTPLEACEELIMKSSRGWIASGMPYRDDISVATSILVRDSSI